MDNLVVDNLEIHIHISTNLSEYTYLYIIQCTTQTDRTMIYRHSFAHEFNSGLRKVQIHLNH